MVNQKRRQKPTIKSLNRKFEIGYRRWLAEEKKNKRFWFAKDLMLEVNPDGFCLWKMNPKKNFKSNPYHWLHNRKMYNKEIWVVDASMIKKTREIRIDDKFKKQILAERIAQGNYYNENIPFRIDKRRGR